MDVGLIAAGSKIRPFKIVDDDCFAVTVPKGKQPDPAMVLVATGHRLNVDNRVVMAMPGQGMEMSGLVEVFFFRTMLFLTNPGLEGFYRERQLRPDPYSHMAVLQEYPQLTYECSTATIWPRGNGVYDHLTFVMGGGSWNRPTIPSEARVACGQCCGFHDEGQWFAGVSDQRMLIM